MEDPGLYALVGLVVLPTSFWVLFDASSECGRKGLSQAHAAMWFFASLLVWIVAFPAYLTQRGKLEDEHFGKGTVVLFCILGAALIGSIFLYYSS